MLLETVLVQDSGDLNLGIADAVLVRLSPWCSAIDKYHSVNVYK